jgi:uncharacterized short protein YbdD (DUF466 family)
MSFDIVIPLGPNELERISQQIDYTKKNVIGYRNIYIVTCNLDVKFDDCIMIDENIFPFKSYIASYFAEYNGKSNRNGWYFQQLIKLYAGTIIKGILDNYLVIDSDVFFLKPIKFIEDEKFILSTGNEYHVPYFTHMKILHDSFVKVYDKSGICHHMLYNKNYINEIFNLVEEKHNKSFWQVFISSVIEHKNHSAFHPESGASEYELYFNYMIKNHPDKIIIRHLNWSNVSRYMFKNCLNNDYDFVSVCAWMG